VTATLPERRAARAAPRPRVLRAEIQALRAVAVGLVVICHSWPSLLPGGFIGVDVFFVISGFLITAQLLGEVDRKGTVSLAGFWARRARRILPAALLVLAAVAAGTLLWVPQNHWDQFLTEIRASTAYVENWQLAHTATDYFANAASVQSPVQHYWSLSAEEQFYLVWPVLIGLAVALRGRRRALALAMGALGLASLAYSIYDTHADPAAAYFITPTRAWEFAAGGLLALLAVRPRGGPLLTWAGLGAIGLAAATYSSHTAFPGFAALLPVLGAVAVIWGESPNALLRARPVQWLGDVSYSVYLWHWPLLILAPYALSRTSLTTPQKVVLVALTLLLSGLSKRWVEDPVRAGPLLARRPARWTFAAALCGTAAVFVLIAGGVNRLHEQIRVAERAAAKTIASKPRCFGAAARDPRHRCHNARLDRTVVPTPADALRIQRPCDAVQRTAVMTVCAFGRRPANPRGTAVLVGDSHAMHLQQTVQVVTDRHRYRALLNARSHCPYSAAPIMLEDAADRAGCNRRNRDLPGWFRAHPDVSVAFIAHFVETSGKAEPQPGQSQFAAEVDGYERAWRALPRSVKRIVVIRDTPETPVGTLDCITRAMDRHQRAGERCAFPRAPAVPRDPAATAARRIHDPRVKLVDLNHSICDRRRCYPVVGGVLVYKDLSHLTPLFATTLGPFLDRRVARLL
jgi:peptidoglycan/LPS O-acetylase OafA/YrhL